MKKTCVTILATLLTAAPAAPAAAAWANDYKIAVLKAQGNGVLLRLEGFTNSDPSVSCVRDTFWIDDTDGNFEERTSFLLAAYFAQATVSVSYYGCSGEHIQLGSVQLS